MSASNYVRPFAAPGREPAPRKSDRTRQAILDGALEFLWTRPYREMTVAALMAATAAGRSAFYQYFRDLHDLGELLLDGIRSEILVATAPWNTANGDPVDTLVETISGFVRVCHERGPVLRAIADASTTDPRLERAWESFVGLFDDAVAARVRRLQREGLVATFNPRPVAVALVRLNFAMALHAFGRRPRGNPDAVAQALIRIWTSTLGGAAGSRS